MRDKIVFHFRFIAVYSVCLTVALLASFGLRFYDNSLAYGFGFQLLAFAVAFAISRRTHRDYLEHLIAQSNRILFDRMILTVLLIAVFTALVAGGIDWLITPIAAYFKVSSFDWVDVNRLLSLGFINTLVAYFITERTANTLIKQGRFVLPEFIPPALPDVAAPEASNLPNAQIMELLIDLPEAKRETLIKGALTPGAPMITFQGSTNDQLWNALSKYGWTQKTRLARSVKKQVPKSASNKKLVGWSVTAKGAEALARMGQNEDTRSNLRIVNG